MLLTFRSLALAPLLLLGACKPAVESQLPPQPPMWVVSDADSEITLYPTLHILPPDVEWKSDELLRRLSDAEKVWFEIMPDAEVNPGLQKQMMELGLAPGTSLSEVLTKDELATLKAATTPLGMPFQAIDMMRPWMASTMVGVGALVQNGFDPNSGVEKQLGPMVKGKNIRALETAQGQLELLASLPNDVQLTMLRDALGEMDETVEILHDLVQGWSVGDVKDLEEGLLERMKTEIPDAYDAIFTKRNQTWVDQIEIEMKGSGTDFIAVGAGHLVGDEGVPAMFTALGYNVRRL